MSFIRNLQRLQHPNLTKTTTFAQIMLVKSFSYHLPFGTKDAYVKEMMAADLNKLANLIRICGFLMQTKVYLFWGR
jgi:hypothetical protein